MGLIYCLNYDINLAPGVERLAYSHVTCEFVKFI